MSLFKQGIAAVRTAVDAILADTGTDGVVEDSQTTARKRLAGVEQVKEVLVNSAANAGDVTLGTPTTKAVIIESVTVIANAAQTGDMTSCGIFANTGKVTTLISAADAIQANLDATHKQLSWTGAVKMDYGGPVLVIALVGTGATAVSLYVTITYRAVEDGGYLA